MANFHHQNYHSTQREITTLSHEKVAQIACRGGGGRLFEKCPKKGAFLGVVFPKLRKRITEGKSGKEYDLAGINWLSQHFGP